MADRNRDAVFETEKIFDEDYLYFYADLVADEASDADTDTICRLLEIGPGMEVLDLACGHGRITNRLAERGTRVTGLDATPLFLDRAREDAARRGVDVEYVHGDMRELPWEGRFDRVLSWFTSYGYFSDDENRRVLEAARRALRPGGRLLIENNNLLFILRHFRPADVVSMRDYDLLVDVRTYDPRDGRFYSERVVVRDGRVRRARFFVRAFTFPELREWLLAAGFSDVDVYGTGGAEFSLETNRMLTVARR